MTNETRIMTPEAADTMNEITFAEMDKLMTLGYVAITGNGQLVAIVPKERAKEFEELRCANGY